MKLTFSEQAWDDYLYWQSHDKKLLKKVNGLIRETLRTPYEGTGHPKQLKGEFAGWWSRRIDKEHRFIYRLDESDDQNPKIEIAYLRFHYHK